MAIDKYAELSLSSNIIGVIIDILSLYALLNEVDEDIAYLSKNTV